MTAVSLILRSISGAQCKVIIALGLLGGFGTLTRLIETSGLTKPTVISSLRELASVYGIVTQANAGWLLTTAGKQLHFGMVRNFLPTTGSLIQEGIESQHQNQEPVQVRNFFTTNQAALYDALFPLGNPKRTEIAFAERMSVEQVKIVVSKWQQTRKSPGWLVHMLEQGAIPETEEESRRGYVEGEYSDFIEH